MTKQEEQEVLSDAITTLARLNLKFGELADDSEPAIAVLTDQVRYLLGVATAYLKEAQEMTKHDGRTA